MLCTATGETPHSRFLAFTRRSHHGTSLPAWLNEPGPVFLRKFVRNGKSDDLVQRVDLIEANPMYACIKYPDGRISNVSLKDLARFPSEEEPFRSEYSLKPNNVEQTSESVEPSESHEMLKSNESSRLDENTDNCNESNADGGGRVDEDIPGPRRSSRLNKGIPPSRYGYDNS